MVVGVLTLELFVPDAGSLKAKRSVVRPLVEKLKRTWNVSVAEVDRQDAWQRATLGIAAVNSSPDHARRVLGEILREAESRPDLQVLDSSIEMV